MKFLIPLQSLFGRIYMSEKKVVSRNIAIAAAIVAIILLVALVGTIINYSNVIATKDSEIESLNTQIEALKSPKLLSLIHI